MHHCEDWNHHFTPAAYGNAGYKYMALRGVTLLYFYTILFVVKNPNL